MGKGGQNIVRGVEISLWYIDPGVKISYDILTPESIYRGVKIPSHTGINESTDNPNLEKKSCCFWLKNNVWSGHTFAHVVQIRNLIAIVKYCNWKEQTE